MLIDKKSNEETVDEDYSLYTETIVVNPLVKYKKAISALKYVVIFLLVTVIIGATAYFLSSYLESKSEEIYIPRENIVLQKDDFDRFGRSPIIDSEIQRIEMNSQYYNFIVYIASQSIIKIGEDSWGYIVGEVDGNYMVVTEYREKLSDEQYVVSNGSKQIGTTVLNKDKSSGIVMLSLSKEESNKLGFAFTTPQLGNSYELRQNDGVVAIGRLNGQVSSASGIIENTSGENGIDITYDMIKTDIMAKEGDFALLFNRLGQFIGIANQAKEYEGEGTKLTAIGVSSMKPLFEAMSKGIPVVYMGVRCTNITKSIATEFGFPEGIYVTEVELDSPAYEAGLQAGDIIYSFDGHEVDSIQQLNELLYSKVINNEVKVLLKRTGKGVYRELEYTVKLSGKGLKDKE